MGFNEGGGSGGSSGNYGRCRSGGSGGSGGSCTGDLWVVGVLRETQEFSGFLERGLKIEIKNFAKGVAGEAIKTFGKV